VIAEVAQEVYIEAEEEVIAEAEAAEEETRHDEDRNAE